MNLRHATRSGVTLSCLAVLTLTACSGRGDAASVTSAPPAPSTTRSTTTSTTPPPAPTTTMAATTTTVAPTTTTTLPPIPRQPLMGTVLADGEAVIDRPALAVKIDNAPGARRNHSGLAVADIVFEEIVEGNITRFAAVFHSQGSSVVGPIRSGRSQDVDILTSFGRPLFAWSGGNPGVTDLIARSALTDLNWQRGGQGYYRGDGAIPHNLYNSTDRLWSQAPADHPGPPPRQFSYVNPPTRFEGEAITGLDVALHGIDVRWTWSEERQQFLRAQEGAPHIDETHGQIGATNVVVMVVEYRPSQIDARSPEAQTIGNGPVWVFSRGRYVTGRWARDSADEPIKLLRDDGLRIRLEPGNTWVELGEAIGTDEPANPDVAMELLAAG